MPEDNKVLEEIQKEIKGYGDDVKALKDSMFKDLEAVRKLAEEAKGAAENPEVKAQIDALTASVEAKDQAIADQVEKIKADAEAAAKAAIEAESKAQQDRIDELEKKLNRPVPGGETAEAKFYEEALEFTRVSLAMKGQLKASTILTPDNVDVDGYKAWNDSYQHYLRRGEKALEAKAMQVGLDPDGGYLVPTAQSSRIITKMHETSPMRQLAFTETISTTEIEIAVDVDEADAGWVGETQARPETGTPQVGVQRISVHELYANPRATQKLIEDAGVDIAAWLARKVADKFARTEATAFISGTGMNQPRGILTYAAAATEAAMARGKILQVNSGHATEVRSDGLVNLTMSLKSRYIANAQWMMRRSTLRDVMLLKDGQGQYLWRQGLTAGEPSMLLGYAVARADDMPVAGAGALAIAFGDFRQGYTIVQRLGITTLVDPYTAKPFVQFYSRMRVGGDVVDFDAFALLKIAE